jgi:hypothetical protein
MVTETRPVNAGGDRYDREIAAADPGLHECPCEAVGRSVGTTQIEHRGDLGAGLALEAGDLAHVGDDFCDAPRCGQGLVAAPW